MGAAAPVLLDGYGRPVRANYEGSGTGRRFRSFLASNVGPTTAIAVAGEQLRNRSRALIRSNAWAYQALESFVANVIGTGITGASIFGMETADGADSGESFRAADGVLWSYFVDEADADGRSDLYGVQSLAVREMFEAGECLIRLRARRPEDDLAVPLQLQVLEPELLPFTKTETLGNGNVVECGIERNGFGQRVAYHVLRKHPGEFLGGMFLGDLDTVRVPAEQIIHLYRPTRAGQLRGEPWLCRVILLLHELGKYFDAEVMRKTINAMFAVFITTTEEVTPGVGTTQGQDATTGVIEQMTEPGSMYRLRAGESIEESRPADVGANFEMFMKHALREFSAGIGRPYEKTSGDYSETNYSSGRLGDLEDRRKLEPLIHQIVAMQLCQPVRAAYMNRAVETRRLAAPGYLTRRREYQRTTWTPQGWKWVDPEKEAKAAIMALAAGLTSWTDVIAEQGGNIVEVWKKRAAEERLANTLGIRVEGLNAMATAAAGSPSGREDEMPRRQRPREAAHA